MWWRDWWELGMLKARARSGVIRDWDKGISSSGGGNSSSHFENQFESSSLILSLSLYQYEPTKPKSFSFTEKKGLKIPFFGFQNLFRTENNELYNQVSREGGKTHSLLCGLKKEKIFPRLTKFSELGIIVTFSLSLSIKNQERWKKLERERGVVCVWEERG